MNYQQTLLIGTILTIIFLISVIIKTKMDLKYGAIWILWGFVMLVLSLYPRLIDIGSRILGISLPVNTIFLVFIFLLYLISFYIFVMISKMRREIKSLTYRLAVLQKKVEEKENA